MDNSHNKNGSTCRYLCFYFLYILIVILRSIENIYVQSDLKICSTVVLSYEYSKYRKKCMEVFLFKEI